KGAHPLPNRQPATLQLLIFVVGNNETFKVFLFFLIRVVFVVILSVAIILIVVSRDVVDDSVSHRDSAEKASYILEANLGRPGRVVLKCSVNGEDLVSLQLQHALLNRRIDDEAHEVGFLDLTDAENAGKSLLLHGVVPPELDENDAICSGEVQTLAPCAKRHDEHLDFIAILELVNGPVALLGGLTPAKESDCMLIILVILGMLESGAVEPFGVLLIIRGLRGRLCISIVIVVERREWLRKANNPATLWTISALFPT
ncbi:SNF2 family domain-containing protein, partial [Colletotrichum scovillei]